jgi:hypothetical protein
MMIMFFWDDAASYPRRRESSTTAVKNSHEPDLNGVHISGKIMIMPELEYTESGNTWCNPKVPEI